MQITVGKIIPRDGAPNTPKILAEVYFYEDEEEAHYHRSAVVTVYLDKREDISFSQLKEEAIEAAIEFLKLAI
jgi:hypothetical protein